MINLTFTPEDYIALATNHNKHLNKSTVVKTLYKQCNKNQSNIINTDDAVFRDYFFIEQEHCENFNISEEIFLFNDNDSTFINTAFTVLKSLVSRKNNIVIDYVFNNAKRPERKLDAYLSELESNNRNYYIYHNAEAGHNLESSKALDCISCDCLPVNAVIIVPNHQLTAGSEVAKIRKSRLSGLQRLQLNFNICNVHIADSRVFQL